MRNSLKKTHHCEFCNKTFNSTYKLKSHLFCHKAVAARFKCTFCFKEYYRRDEFNRHIATHNNQQKRYVCDHCDRVFIGKRNLINHLYLHDDLHLPLKKFQCNACDVRFCEERLLKYHIRRRHMNLVTINPIHMTKNLNDSWIEQVDASTSVQITKIKSNMLSIKRFNKKSIEKNDKEFLLGQKAGKVDDKVSYENYLASPFAMKNNNRYSKAICDYCNKEMLKKSLIAHIRERHLNNRRFKCGDCFTSFNRPYLLTNHVCKITRKNKRICRIKK